MDAHGIRAIYMSGIYRRNIYEGVAQDRRVYEIYESFIYERSIDVIYEKLGKYESGNHVAVYSKAMYLASSSKGVMRAVCLKRRVVTTGDATHCRAR